MVNLTTKQDHFARLMALPGDGDYTQSNAYWEAYDASNMSPESVWVEASRLMDNPKVALRIRELGEPVEARATVDTNKILDNLESIALYGKRDSDRIAASDKLLKALGAYRDNSKDNARPMVITHVTVQLAGGTKETREIQAPYTVDGEASVSPDDYRA